MRNHYRTDIKIFFAEVALAEKLIKMLLIIK